MAAETKIEWADATFNPWTGCTKISPACDNCYAETWARRAGRGHLWKGQRSRTTPAYWAQPHKWDRQAEAEGRRIRVFCASLADVFDNQVPDDWRRDLWQLIRLTPRLDWLLLTKRPQNIAKMLPPSWGEGWPNVWLGTTVENQAEADKRILHLMKVPAAVRFLSCEPLLGPIDLKRVAVKEIKYETGIHYLDVLRSGCWSTSPFIRPSQPDEEQRFFTNHSDLGRINWVIAGGETGHGARDTLPAWFRSLRDQCADAGTAFFFKQMPKKAAIPDDLLVRQFPASAASAQEAA